MPRIGVQEHHVGIEQQRVVFLGDPQEVARDDDLSAAMLDDEPHSPRCLRAVVHGEGRDGEVPQQDGDARLNLPEVAPLGQIAVDAVGAVLPALRAGVDRQRPGLIGSATADQAHRQPIELGEMIKMQMRKQNLMDNVDAMCMLELQQGGYDAHTAVD